MALPAKLDQKFWTGFARNIWEKKPLSLKNVQSSLSEISADEIFKLLVLFADRCRKLNDSEGFKFYIDGFKADPDEVLQVLPEKSDKSLLGYHERMKALFPDYCLVCDELLQVNHSKQHLLTEFTDQLYQHVGFPNRFSEMGLYLGNYRKTPFGVHVDSCGVFSFPVVGKKEFRLWSPEYVKKNPSLDRAFSYEKHKKHSQLLEAGPGDITYWPSSAWHIAESDGSFSATWSLGVWVDKSHQEIFSDNLKNFLSEKVVATKSTGTTAYKYRHSKLGEVIELPKAYQDSIALLQKLTTAELQEAFLSSWMKHISSQGFKTVPTGTVKISPKSRLSLRNPKAPILWQQSATAKNKIHLSFGGILVNGVKNGGLHKLVLALNSGESAVVGSYLKSSAAAKKDLQALQLLADAGAFSRGEAIL
ncbi:JmjC domain-containing protein [Bdellovibrio sp. HCB274]|uniref:JmjC domain-containing protein n=1 Tax=Bdellovibrio sp. HCB274 TaxID=3394361 RepID=UPI0039B512EF